jgi:hypothetical protein
MVLGWRAFLAVLAVAWLAYSLGCIAVPPSREPFIQLRELAPVKAGQRTYRTQHRNLRRRWQDTVEGLRNRVRGAAHTVGLL